MKLYLGDDEHEPFVMKLYLGDDEHEPFQIAREHVYTSQLDLKPWRFRERRIAARLIRGVAKRWVETGLYDEDEASTRLGLCRGIAHRSVTDGGAGAVRERDCSHHLEAVVSRRTDGVASELQEIFRRGVAMKIVLAWSGANSGDEIGSVGWITPETGWPGFIEKHVKPAIKWCRDSGVTPIVLLHHPFGQYSPVEYRPRTPTPDNPRNFYQWEAMHLDGWDYAKAADVKWLLNKFATVEGWKQVTSTTDCYAYVGGVDITPRLRNLPPAELAATIKRNLQPMKDAGFKGIYLDAAANAIPSMFTGINKDQSVGRSLDTITMAIADAMFSTTTPPYKAVTGVEAAPRAFPAFRSLWHRPVVAANRDWLHCYGPTGRNPNWQALGYDDAVLKGPIWRQLDYSDDVPGTIAAAKAIIQEGKGHIVSLSPQPLIRAGVKASDLFET